MKIRLAKLTQNMCSFDWGCDLGIVAVKEWVHSASSILELANQTQKQTHIRHPANLLPRCWLQFISERGKQIRRSQNKHNNTKQEEFVFIIHFCWIGVFWDWIDGVEPHRLLKSPESVSTSHVAIVSLPRYHRWATPWLRVCVLNSVCVFNSSEWHPCKILFNIFFFPLAANFLNHWTGFNGTFIKIIDFLTFRSELLLRFAVAGARALELLLNFVYILLAIMLMVN